MKYGLIDETIILEGKILHRVKAGDLGGFVESMDNLSQEGNCWVANNAKVYGGAKVYGDAVVEEEAQIYDWAEVFEGHP